MRRHRETVKTDKEKALHLAAEDLQKGGRAL
jgi:hypothetical protein